MHHTPIDAEALAANAIGSTIGNEITARFPNQQQAAENDVDAAIRSTQQHPSAPQPRNAEAKTQHQSAHPDKRKRPDSATPAYDAADDHVISNDETTAHTQIFHKANTDTTTPQSAQSTRAERWKNTVKKDWSTRIHDANSQDMKKVAAGMDILSGLLDTTGNILDKLSGDGRFLHIASGATNLIKDSVESTHKMTNDLIFGNGTQRIAAGKEYAIYAATTLIPGALGKFGKPLLKAAPAYLSKISSLWKQAPVKTIELNRFHQAARNLSEEGQQNIRILRNWAKSRGWKKASNLEGRPEKWGEVVNGKFKPRLVIKPEPNSRPGIHPISTKPRFEARVGQGAYDWINPFTGIKGNSSVGEHIWIENPYLNHEEQMAYINLENSTLRNRL